MLIAIETANDLETEFEAAVSEMQENYSENHFHVKFTDKIYKRFCIIRKKRLRRSLFLNKVAG